MLPNGSLRWIAIAVVLIGLALLGLSNYRYGLAGQSVMVVGIVPLLFAGLLLGRAGVWATLACYVPILLLGAWVDLQGDMAGVQSRQEVLSNLLQLLLGSLLLALILDRLVGQIVASRRRNRDLAMLCRRLAAEIGERERSQQQLLHSQRVDALGKLAANVAHDFNNLLAVVQGHARRAEDMAGADPELRQVLERIGASTRRGKALTSKLLALARSDEDAVERFDANQAVADMGPLLRPLFAPAVSFEVETSEAPAWVRMGRDSFEALLLNMARNASDALAEAGEFRLSVTVEAGEVLIRVADDGSGMTPEVAARIFEPFYTTKPRGQGTGIGLAVACRVVIEAHGRIEVDSRPGEGTCFTIRLPLAA
ncbi:MAG: HAMP domain-containing sensor histidine kinase [Pseudoxanthomonas sp.]